MSHAFLHAPFKASNQQCAKVAYPSRREAMRMVKKHGPSRPAVKSGSGKLGAFHCNVCGLFHLGHQ